MKLFALYLKSRDSLTRIIGRVQNWNIKGLSFYLRTLPNYWQVTVTMHSVGHSQFWCSLGIEHQILAEIMLWQVSSCTSNNRKSWALWRSDAITVNECCPVQWLPWCLDVKSLGGGAVGLYCGMWQEEGWFSFPSLSSHCLAGCPAVFVSQETTLWGFNECLLFPFSSPLGSSDPGPSQSLRGCAYEGGHSKAAANGKISNVTEAWDYFAGL